MRQLGGGKNKPDYHSRDHLKIPGTSSSHPEILVPETNEMAPSSKEEDKEEEERQGVHDEEKNRRHEQDHEEDSHDHDQDHAHEDEESHDHVHDHGGIFGEKTELIFSLAGGGLLATGFGLSFAGGIPGWVSLASL